MLLPILAAAQSPQVKALSIGDTVPDITITNVYNYPSSTIRLSDLKGKLVILDFWATWCGACLSAFPEMHSLKKKFGDQLQILFVNSYNTDDSIKVKRTFNRMETETGEKVELPYILYDTILSRYFPHRLIPHYIWLDSSKRVIAITSKEEATAKNIQAFLSGEPLHVEMKDDDIYFNSKVPLLVNNNGGAPGDFLYRTIVTGYKPNFGVTSGMIKDSTGKIRRAFFINTHILDLLFQAYPEIRDLDQCRILFKTPGAKRFMHSEDRNIERANSYCYELIIPGINENELWKYMQSDLKRYLHAGVTIESKVMDCYVLTANSNIKKVFSKGGDASLEMLENTLHKRMRRQSIKVLAKVLTNILNKPVINESGVLHNIDMDFPYDIRSYDFEKMRAFLANNGFELTASKRKIKVAVISEAAEE